MKFTPNNTMSYSLEILLKIILQQYFNSSYCVAIISEEELNLKLNFSSSYIYAEEDEDLYPYLYSASELGCSDYVVQMYEPTIFMKTYELYVRESISRPSDGKIIFVPTFDRSNKKEITEILELKLSNDIANLLLILPATALNNSCDVYDVATNKFIGDDEQISKIEYLDQWNSCSMKFQKNTDLFPHTIDNMYGRTLTVASFHFEPFVMAEFEDDPDKIDGIEIKLIEEFCRWINCTLVIIKDDKQRWGEIFPNGTHFGALGIVYDGTADFGIGSMFPWYVMYSYIDYSSPCYSATITCLVPSPRLLFSWKMPALAFEAAVWIMIAFVYFVSAIAVYFVFSNTVNGFILSTFGIFVSQPMHLLDHSFKVRLLTISLYLYAVLIEAGYDSGLAASLTTRNYEKSLDTVEDFIESDLSWGSNQDAWIFSLNLSEQHRHQILIEQFKIGSDADLVEMSLKREVAFPVIKLETGMVAIEDHVLPEVIFDMQLLLEDLYVDNTVVITQKRSPYKTKLNDLISRIHEHGMFLAWQKQVSLEYLQLKIQLRVKYARVVTDNTRLPLTLEQLSMSYCTTFLLESNFNFSPDIFNVVVNIIHTNSSNNFEDLMISTYDAGCTDFVVQVKKPVEFLNSLAKVSQQAKRRANRKIIILPFNIDKLREKEINDIIEHNEVKFISNILLIQPTETNKFNKCQIINLATKDFVASEPKAIDLDKWNSCTENFQRNSNLFPFDITDLRGKIFKVAAFTYKPYVIVEDDDPMRFDGTEARIVEEFCSLVNCTIEIINDEAEWGEIYENGTGVGILADVAEDKADVALAAVYYWYDQYKFVDYTTYCLRSGITAIAPSPRLSVSWILPLLPFDWTMWLVLVATFIFSSCAVYIAIRPNSNDVFFTTYSILIMQSPREPSRRLWAFRSISGWLLVATLIIDNAYSSGLSSLFTVPLYEAPIDYIQDLVDRRMPWAATHEAWIFSIQTSEEPQVKQLVSQFRVKDPETLEKLSFGRSTAFSLERLEGGNFALGDYITNKVAANYRIMLQDFYYEYSTLVLRKNSPYKEKLNQLILRVHESGLFYAWEQQIALNYLDYKVQTKIKLSRTKMEAEIEPLSVIRLVGIFIIYILGVLISTAVFFIEILIKKFNKNKG